MNDFSQAFSMAGRLLLAADADLLEIVVLSLQVSLLSVLISCLIGLPVGAALAMTRFLGRDFLVILSNALMGLPPVVVGLTVYMLLSNAGPFGNLGLLYSPSAMVIAQIVLITPIVIALSREILEQLHEEYADQFLSLCVPFPLAVQTLLWDARLSLLTVILAAFGRAIAEVGAVIMVGGNINHLTRVMTTAIALETSKGDLPLALALGIILISLSLAVNASVMLLKLAASRRAYA